jgi:hypothetical protein
MIPHRLQIIVGLLGCNPLIKVKISGLMISDPAPPLR